MSSSGQENAKSSGILSGFLEAVLQDYSSTIASEDLLNAERLLRDLAEADPYLQAKLERIAGLITSSE